MYNFQQLLSVFSIATSPHTGQSNAKSIVIMEYYIFCFEWEMAATFCTITLHAMEVFFSFCYSFPLQK